MTIALAVEIPATQKSLLLCLANYVNEQNKFWPSYGTLAKDSGMCRRTVITHMNKFVNMGLVGKKIQTGTNGNTSNLYTFKGVQYLKNLGYTIELTDTGYIKISPPQPNKLEGCKTNTPPSDRVAPASDPVAPNTINEPIKKKDIYANLDFSQWPERPPNEFLDEHVSHRKQKRSVKLSQPVLDRLGKQVTKAISMGYPLTEILNKWLSKAWIGFEAEWLTNENGMKTTSGNDGSDRAKKLLAQSRHNFGMDKK